MHSSQQQASAKDKVQQESSHRFVDEDSGVMTRAMTKVRIKMDVNYIN